MVYQRRLLRRADTKTNNRPICDFCGNSLPLWLYAAKRMSTGVEQACWRWAACIDCAEDIENKDWGKLKQRMARALQRFSVSLNADWANLRRAVEVSLQSFWDDVIEIGGKTNELET